MIYNIYYINFDKVYEIKMMLSNIITTVREIESNIEKGNNDELKAKVGVKFLNLFSGEVGGNTKTTSSDSKKVLETFEIKMTKSVILNEVIQNSSLINDFGGIQEGELIKLDNVKLSLENEAELRTVKLFSNGTFKGMVVPGANGLDINNIFNSMLKDYAYKIKGVVDDKNERVLIKVPLSFENEFESSYGVDDLFIGKVSIVGIYKGKININTLRNSFQFFQKIGSLQGLNANVEDREIIESQYLNSKISNGNYYPFASDDEDVEYHYIDLLAITQNVNFQKDISS